MASLIKQRGFTPLVALIFLNAFIDLGHKITIQNTIFKLYDGQEQIILTAIINAFILLPYIVFFRPAGKTSDKYDKNKVLRITSAAAFFIMLAISLCYWQGWFWPAFFLTLVLALQSAYYGPAKLGYLKELVSNEQLKKANGIAQSLLMVAILSGILVFSALFEWRFSEHLKTPTDVIRTMLPLALILSSLALAETLLAWRLPTSLRNNKGAKPAADIRLKETLQSKDLLPVIIGLSVFWSVGQMLLAVYPAFAKETLGVSGAMLIQAVLAMIAIGIMLGALLDGFFSRHFIQLRLLPIAGLSVVFIGLILPFNQSLSLATALFLIMGVAGGVLVVPLNSLLQFCSPPHRLGSSIAHANFIQNVTMLSCLLLTIAFSLMHIAAWQILFLIAFIAAIGLGSMVYLMPHTIKSLGSKAPLVHGFNQLIGYGPVLFVVDVIDQAAIHALQQSYPRQIQRGLSTHWNDASVCLVTKLEWQKATIPTSVTTYQVDINSDAQPTIVSYQ